MSGCQLCSSGTQCISWSSDSANPSSLWSDYFGIWIGLICLGGIFALVLIYVIYVSVTKPPLLKLSSKLES